MRGGILAAGILLLILGMFLYFTGSNMIQEIEAYNVEGIPISELWKMVSTDAQRQYEIGRQMVMFGSIFGFVGFILCIAGIAVPSKKPQIVIKESSRKESLKPDRRCPSCGRVIPFDARTCPYCSKKFEVEVEKEETREKTITKSPKYCPECGIKLEEELNFCTNCGAKLR